MTSRGRAEPIAYKGVMVSSTFTDLVQHRRALMKAIDGQELKSIGMENDSALPGVDVLDSSLRMVRKAAAYVGVISHKYGQIPDDPLRNPEGLSLTELEFNEAVRLGRPILLFIMGDRHKVAPADVERDPEKLRKLDAFRERAKRLSPGSAVHRVYKVFNDVHEFEVAATQAVAGLRRYLDEAGAPPPAAREGRDVIPAPPAFYAEPPYIGSHRFVGREAQLETLSDWASPADPHPILLFEAIGGAGKSMLTWEWTTKHALEARDDWAGRFWYSFYEKGAVMADFCRRALAYITERPLEELRKRKTAELSEMLLHHLRARPWLLILDGLERVLVAYHRIDAAQLADEEAGSSDQIAHRDPCAAIRPEDDELLRALASAAPSKLLLTSRLIPRVLLNPASQPIPGVLHERLPGLRPADAEALLRSCGVTGTSREIQNFLKSHCDCHPLVTGVLAGLINDYLPDRGNFDAWADAPDGGAALNLAELDLVQKRNHILRTAIDALSERSRQLLSTLALLSEAVDYATLAALHPHDDLAATVKDLERRGLLQYDTQAKRYDLHPVVRGVAAGALRKEERESYGQRVVDVFSQRSHDPYDEAETLDDVRDGLQVIRTLMQMGRYQDAAEVYGGELAHALFFNLEAHAAVLSLLRPFFARGWNVLPDGVRESDAAYLANAAGFALTAIGDVDGALAAYSVSLGVRLRQRNWRSVRVSLSNIAAVLHNENRLAAMSRFVMLSVELAKLIDIEDDLFRARLDRFALSSLLGNYREAEETWKRLDVMGREWARAIYRPGMAELSFGWFSLYRGTLTEEHLAHVEQLGKAGKDRGIVRLLHCLRGEWQIEQRNWAAAANSLHEAIRMAREVGAAHARPEAQLALANFHLGRLEDPLREAEQLSSATHVSYADVAALWLAVGDHERATEHALAAYEMAWADGEPFVHRYYLNQARALLDQLGVPPPDLPPYDPAKDEKFPWEDDVAAAIEELRAEKATGGTPGGSSTNP